MLIFVILLILRHDVKNTCSDIHCVKYAKIRTSSDAFFPSTILPLYGKILIRFCPYTEKHRSKIYILVNFTQWLGRNDSFLIDWLHNFNVSDAIGKTSKLLPLKTYFFPTFLFADKSSQKTSHCFLKLLKGLTVWSQSFMVYGLK